MGYADRAAGKACSRHTERFVKWFGLWEKSHDGAEEQKNLMSFYFADTSPYSARVRMQINAKGITDIVFELPEHWGMPQFRERFPIGRIPVLDIDGDMMPESEVIAEYLEAIYPKH